MTDDRKWYLKEKISYPDFTKPYPLGFLQYRCPYCNYLNEIIIKPQPISLKLTCTKCNKEHEYEPIHPLVASPKPTSQDK